MASVDENIKEYIVESLCNEKQVDASNITVKVKGGIVELTGTVSSPQAREAAERCASKVSKISKVRNFVVVVADPPNDPLTNVA